MYVTVIKNLEKRAKKMFFLRRKKIQIKNLFWAKIQKSHTIHPTISPSRLPLRLPSTPPSPPPPGCAGCHYNQQ